STFTINGKPQNETTFNSLVGGEMGVSTSLVAGDDQFVRETKEWLGNGVIGIIVKTAVGGNSAITWSPARVQKMLRDSAALAVKRELAGDFKPYTLARPYQLEVVLSTSQDTVVKQIDGLMERFKLTRGERPRSYKMTANSARDIGYLFDAIETIVLRAPATAPRTPPTTTPATGRN
ncbi:MAG: M55 family metallopeptidase, partial [Longimicrobiales bacterium]